MKELEKHLKQLGVNEEVVNEIKDLVTTEDIEKFKEIVKDYNLNELNYLTKRLINNYSPDINCNSKISFITGRYKKFFKEKENNINEFINNNLNYQGIGVKFFNDIILLPSELSRLIASRIYENKDVDSEIYDKILANNEQYKELKQIQLFFLLFSSFLNE